MGLSRRWDTLLEQSGVQNVFLTWEWLANWIDICMEDQDLLVIALVEGEKLVAVAPFWVEKRRYRSLPPLRILRLAGSPEADYVDLIVTSEKTAVCVDLIWDQLFGRLRREWDVFEYFDVPSESPVLKRFLEKAAGDRHCLKVETIGHSVCPYIALPADWETFLSGFSRSGRYTITYSGRRLSEQGALEFQLCDNPDDVERQMNVFISLHQKNWVERGKPGAFATKASRDFHHRVAKAMFDKGRLFLAALYLDENHIGSLYGFDYGKKIYYYLLGVETNPVKRIKTGTALLALCIKEAIDRGCTEFDFLRGAEEYKYRWTRLDRRNPQIRFYNRSTMARVTILLRGIRRGLRNVVGRGHQQAGG